MTRPNQALSVIVDAEAIRRLPALADCKPGIMPLEYNVLVAHPEAPKQQGSIILPDEVREREEMAAQVVLLVDVSPLAFRFEGRAARGAVDDEPLASSLDHAPQPGDVVIIGRYSGREWQGADGRLYRTMKDRDVAAVVAADVVAAAREQG